MTEREPPGRWSRLQPCEPCDGTGFCPRCSGNGRYAVRGQEAWVDCDACASSGECPACDGTGYITLEDWGLDYE